MLTKLKVLTTVLLLPIVALADNPDFETAEGGFLYLLRSGVETHRAEFVFASDCEHVASIMNKAEPLVSWYCSTSIPDIELDCELSDIKILHPDTGERLEQEKLQFSISLNRGVANTSLTAAISSFTYVVSDKGYMLTNDYLYAGGNGYSIAIYSIFIDRDNGQALVRDINGKSNGGGECRMVE